MGRRFGTSRIDLSHPVTSAVVRPKAVVLLLLIHCLLLLPFRGLCLFHVLICSVLCPF